MLLSDSPPIYLQDYFVFLRETMPTVLKCQIGVQVEHTLVRRGGRDSCNASQGTVPTRDGDYYLVRIEDSEQYKDCQFVLDYSQANIRNIQSSQLYADIAGKLVYAPPLLYPYCTSGRRDINCISLFSGNHSPRRSDILHKTTALVKDFSNMQGLYGDSLYRMFRRAKVIVNVHQTDHHHTLEELRVLPALLAGAIVISEDSPCREQIPYHEYIIWSDYASIPKTALEVVRNYDYHFNRLFGERSGLPNVFHTMREEFIRRVTNIHSFTWGVR